MGDVIPFSRGGDGEDFKEPRQFIEDVLDAAENGGKNEVTSIIISYTLRNIENDSERAHVAWSCSGGVTELLYLMKVTDMEIDDTIRYNSD